MTADTVNGLQLALAGIVCALGLTYAGHRMITAPSALSVVVSTVTLAAALAASWALMAVV
ncbi:hypothetical protein [Streptomyces sp. NPDC058486]|uniref:hypothetical protein n=1 Tax=unclassified Streptomyces TaxID=2593676 RepID=UPI003653D1EE